MSYLVLSLIMSGIVGFIGMFVLVTSVPTENPYHVMWFSAVFCAVIASLSWFTVGWPAASTSILAAVVCGLISGSAGHLSFAWGRALIALANTSMVKEVLPLNWLRHTGLFLESMQTSLNRPFRR